MDASLTYVAILLMESHGLAPNVRSTSFSSVQVWAKLYQAGPYFLDLNLRPGDDQLSLHGEVMIAEGDAAPERGAVTLYGGAEGTEVAASATLDGGLTFALPVERADSYRLVISLGEETLTVEELTID